jgi:hypothetical protein
MKACYWKNGKRTNLSVAAGGVISSGAYSITVVGTDVYILGGYTTDNNNNFNRKVCYWKNGTRTNLAVPDEMPVPAEMRYRLGPTTVLVQAVVTSITVSR